MLEPHEQVQYPWHRVVGGDGKLGKPKRSATGETQADLLLAEGIMVEGSSIESSLATRFIPAEQLISGVKKQTRPANAPVPKLLKNK